MRCIYEKHKLASGPPQEDKETRVGRHSAE